MPRIRREGDLLRKEICFETGGTEDPGRIVYEVFLSSEKL